MATCIIAGKQIECETVEEHAAGQLAYTAFERGIYSAPSETFEQMISDVQDVTVNAYLPGREYATDQSYTRVVIEVTPEIVARAKAIYATL